MPTSTTHGSRSRPDRPGLLASRAHGILTITLDRPARRNAMTAHGWAALRDVLRDVDPRRDRAVLLTGAGETFCAGADLADTAENETGDGDGDGDGDDDLGDLDGMRIVGEACLTLHRVPVPTIAAVDGAAVGAGMNLALACDFVVAADRARFSQIFVRRALSVDFGGSWILPRLVGLHRAKELVLRGEFISAGRAREMGLVHEVVPPDRLAAAAGALAAELAAGPQLALMQSKALLNGAFEVSLERALDEEARAQALNLASAEAAEAFEAFREKRPADFAAARSGRAAR
ncbi:enoyl-CoA hydratase/isomerase family protein [Actinomadura algeriensis]|uniref:2-(1,2-epoxy-1,2-dihydrophenyl)acetyl-CoA isomerase n=1 Tax=Actinomadura algeriensis TaxID=1679523 RepID=A0ABR9JZT3_9ACTN|nr:enoyl-CoA hydratase-related protein [Actinomadura algeriensis]MBE1535893.1 2-(1,2-epoxy-1,2-dihydrophenyl)acetyl-CoA isomerase [Actinomadura algeriensis]